MSASGQIARLKVTLNDVEPAVVRRVEVALAIKLSDLHLVIQTVMPWWNYHLYEFQFRNSRWGVPDPEFDRAGGPHVQPAKKATLADLAATGGVKTFRYLYDFGDGWEHMIKIERIVEAEPGATYPRLIEAAGRCPPEDVGGPPGYEEYLLAIADPDHESHEDIIRWRGPGFNPNTLDEAEIKTDLEKLARRWSRKKAKTPRVKPR